MVPTFFAIIPELFPFQDLRRTKRGKTNNGGEQGGNKGFTVVPGYID